MNRSADRARVLVVLDGDGIAALITELRSVIARAGRSGLADDLLQDYATAHTERVAKLRAEGLL